MSGVIAATVVVGAVSANQQAQAAKGAAGSQERAAAEAIAEERRQFDIAQAAAAPFQEAGVQALRQEQALLGLSGVESQQQALEAFQASPGQAFLQERGQQALLRSEAAIGGLGGGRVREALVQQGVGFAQQDLQNQLASLSALRTGGQAITSNQAQLGAQSAQNIGSRLVESGQAQALGIGAAGAAQGQFTTGALTSIAGTRSSAGQAGSGLLGLL